MSAPLFASRGEMPSFMKRLWAGEPTLCPKCGRAELVPLHKRLKKEPDRNDWQCPVCGEIYRTINMMYDLPDQ